MDQDRIDGIGHQIKGAAKAAAGRIIGDAKLASDGAAEQASGKAQADAGTLRDAATGIDQDRIQGIGHQLRGVLKQAFGKITGDAAIQADGAAEQASGKAQNAAGSARAAARDALEAKAGRDDKPPTP